MNSHRLFGPLTEAERDQGSGPKAGISPGRIGDLRSAQSSAEGMSVRGAVSEKHISGHRRIEAHTCRRSGSHFQALPSPADHVGRHFVQSGAVKYTEDSGIEARACADTWRAQWDRSPYCCCGNRSGYVGGELQWAPLGSVAVTSWANSDVSPLGSVAVALIDLPVVSDVANETENVALPFESVVTNVVPSSVCPWPKPDGSAVSFAKNWSV